MKRKILIVTERRADYSKFRPVIQQIKKSSKLQYYLIVTGSHLLQSHGKTINEIKKDNIRIFSTFPMYIENDHDDSGAKMTKAFGRAILHLTELIQEIQPDIILTGFDIGANLAAAIIGAHMNIVVAHMEGGEVTGTIDESIRHATTKFSHIHFTTHKEASKRLMKMGENPKYIFTAGNPSLDSILAVQNIPENELQEEFGINFSKPFVIVLQHPVTSEVNKADLHMRQTLEAIKELNLQAIIIKGNADAGSRKIAKIIEDYKIKSLSTIPFNSYINLLKRSSALIGNSSSGIMEAPFLHIPSINIGTRQEGRLRQPSIIDVSYDKNKIKNAIKKVINDKQFLLKVKKQKNMYGDGHSSERIVQVLTDINLKTIPIQKKLMY